MRFILGFILLITAVLQNTNANIVVAGPTDFRDAVDLLVAGDTLYLSPGNYTLSLRIENLHGTALQPILISGQAGQSKPVFIGNSCCNTVSLTQSEFIHLRDIICDGQNIVGIDAIKAEGSIGNWTHDIEIEGFEIYNYGADQQNVGISTKCPSWNWWVHHNVIEAVGTGMYFGNSNGADPFVNGLIEYNLVKNTVGYNCQIKHQNLNTRDLSIGMPANGKTTLRYNVFSKAENASSGNAARPNLLVGNFPENGNGTNDFYEIYGNLFFQNPTEGLFQGTGNIGFYNNLLFNNAGGWGVAIQTHVGFQPRAIDVFFNTVLISGSSGISISGENINYTQNVWANAVFSPSPIAGGQLSQNLTDGYSLSSNYLKSSDLPLGALDLTPLNSALQIVAIDIEELSNYENSDRDFDGKQRNGSYAGAYFSNASPGWALQLMIRDEVPDIQVTSEAEIFLESTSILIYPCPTNDTVEIEGLIGAYDIEVLNVNGMVFQSLNSNSDLVVIDVQALPAGIFFIRIKNKLNNQLFIQKMLKE